MSFWGSRSFIADHVPGAAAVMSSRATVPPTRIEVAVRRPLGRAGGSGHALERVRKHDNLVFGQVIREAARDRSKVLWGEAAQRAATGWRQNDELRAPVAWIRTPFDEALRHKPVRRPR